MAAVKKVAKNTQIVKVVIKEEYPHYEIMQDYDDDIKTKDLSKEGIGQIAFQDSKIKIDYYPSERVVSKSFRADITEVPHCCGMSEVGNLNISADFPVQGVKDILEALSKEVKGHTFIINTNGKGASLKVETALANSIYWTKVKQFRNNGAGNTISVWISNND